jgi:hypothetical protein
MYAENLKLVDMILGIHRAEINNTYESQNGDEANKNQMADSKDLSFSSPPILNIFHKNFSRIN